MSFELRPDFDYCNEHNWLGANCPRCSGQITVNSMGSVAPPSVDMIDWFGEVVSHVVVNSPEAHKELVALCNKWRGGNAMFIDWEQSKYSYDLKPRKLVRLRTSGPPRNGAAQETNGGSERQQEAE